jgi:uncharacterized membrane protein
MRNIEAAVRDSERQHRGEIRFVVEAALHPLQLLHGITPRQRALELFAQLRVWDTEHNSGVLVYLLLADRDVEIVADRGIHGCVGSEGWQDICSQMEAAFRRGEFEAGAVVGITQIGKVLQRHFPAGAANPNELPNTPVIL